MSRSVRVGLMIAGLALAAGCGPVRRAASGSPAGLAWNPKGDRPLVRQTQIDPKTAAMGDFVVGEVALNDGNYDVGLKAFRAAVAHDPESPLLRQRLAMLLVRKGMLPEALEHCEEVVRIEPGNTEARLLYAGILSALNRQDEAVAQYRHVIEVEPKNQEAYL